MVVTYHGGSHFKLQTGDVVIAVNPIEKESSYKAVRYGADVALVTMRNPEHFGIKMVTHAGKEPFVVSGPGEYEVKKIFIKGAGVPVEYKGARKINTIYALQFDGIRICFVGFLSDASVMTGELYGVLGEVDLLFMYTGGSGGITPTAAAGVARRFQPGMIVPVPDMSDTEALDLFVKEWGGDGENRVDKLTIKKKDITDDVKIVVFKSVA